MFQDIVCFAASCALWWGLYHLVVGQLEKICTKHGYWSLEWRQEYATYILSTLHAISFATPYACYRYMQGSRLYETPLPIHDLYLGVYCCLGASYFLVDMIIMYGPMKHQTKPSERLVYTFHHSLSIALIFYCYYESRAIEWHATKTALLACEFPVLFLNIYHHFRMTSIPVPADPHHYEAATTCPTFMCLFLAALNSVCMAVGYFVLRIVLLLCAIAEDMTLGSMGPFVIWLLILWVMQIFFTCELTKRAIKSVKRVVVYWQRNK